MNSRSLRSGWLAVAVAGALAPIGCSHEPEIESGDVLPALEDLVSSKSPVVINLWASW